MSSVGETLAAIKQAMEEVGAAWFVFGAQAVVVRGAPRATQDIDVTVRHPRSRLPELVGALARQGVEHRFPDLADELLRHGAVLPMNHRSGMEVDLVVSGTGLEDLVASRASVVPIDGVDVPVAQATDLVVMKVLAGRGKDLDDVRGLLAGGEVDLTEVRDLLVQLEQALGQSDLVPAFEAARRDVGA